MRNRPLQVLYAGLHVGRGDFPAHSHEVWELIYQQEGHVVTYHGDTPIKMSVGMVLVTPPGVVHRDAFLRPYQLIYLFVEGDILERCPVTLSDTADGALGRIFEGLLGEWQQNLAHRQTMCAMLAGQLEVLIDRQLSLVASRQQGVGGEMDPRLLEAERLLRGSISAPITLPELAKHIGVSRSWLHEAFLQAFGRSPHAYVAHLRLEKGLALLRHSSHPIGFIAEECGYASASHFTQHVKQVTGRSPTGIRNAAREAEINRETGSASNR